VEITTQVHYHLSHAPRPFAFSLFFRKCLALLPELASALDPPISASPVAGITGMHHATPSPSWGLWRVTSKLLAEAEALVVLLTKQGELGLGCG
jgi:hypothetical protein